MARLVRARLVPASLTGRVFALYAAALVAVVAAMSLLFYRYQFTDAIDGAVSSAQALADVMLPAVSDSAVIGDFDTIRRTLAKATRQAHIASASFLAAQGGRIAVSTRSTASWSPAWLRRAVDGRLGEVNTVVAVGGVDYGVMRLSFDTAGPSAHDDHLPEPAAIVEALHRRLTPRLIELDTFVTLALYRFDIAQGRLTFVNAGHTAGLLRRRGGTVERLLGDNLPLGVLAKERYQEGTTAISAGDALLVYSDGISEARDAHGEELGEAGLQRLLASLEVGAMPSHTALQVLRKRLHERIGASAGSDDETAVLIRVAEVPNGAAADTDASAAQIELPWDLAHLGRLREGIEAAATVLPADAADRLVLASFEAASNVVRHVVPPFDGATLLCRPLRDRSGVTVELWYVGPRFEPTPVPPPDFSGASEGGFGLYII